MFSGLAIFFSFAVLFGLEQQKYSIAEMLILWLGTFALVRYIGSGALRGPHRLRIPPAAWAGRGGGLAGGGVHGGRLSHAPDPG
jgi:hypothetical protein